MLRRYFCRIIDSLELTFLFAAKSFRFFFGIKLNFKIIDHTVLKSICSLSGGLCSIRSMEFENLKNLVQKLQNLKSAKKSKIYKMTKILEWLKISKFSKISKIKKYHQKSFSGYLCSISMVLINNDTFQRLRVFIIRRRPARTSAAVQRFPSR